MSIAISRRTEDEQDDISERGDAIYEERLRDDLERDFAGKFVASHVDSGDYEVAVWSGDATRALLARDNVGLLYVRVIGARRRTRCEWRHVFLRPP